MKNKATHFPSPIFEKRSPKATLYDFLIELLKRTIDKRSHVNKKKLDFVLRRVLVGLSKRIAQQNKTKNNNK